MAVKKSPAGKTAKPPRRKKAPSAIKRLEGAILATVAEADELAVELGLAGAVPPKTPKKRKTKR